jgi:peptidoglycan/xylan/chitin deacetylase (PgdA/CDA1 family)/GT2 family glycosyltransferase
MPSHLADRAERLEQPVAAAPHITVIIPVLDAEETIAAQLEALAGQAFEPPWELIVADNGSTDASMEVALSFSQRLPLRIVDAHQIRGAAYARNVAAAEARAPLLAFVDADDVVEAGWLAAMVAALQDHPVVASRFDAERLNPAAARATRGLAQSSGLARHDYARFLPHVGGSGLGVWRSAHEAIGGFDLSLKRLEDTDYAWRLQLAGHAIHFEPTALLHVRYRTTMAASVRQSYLYGRSDGHLYVRYRSHGMERVSLLPDVRHIVLVLLQLLRRVDPTRRERLLRSLVNRTGIVVGRIEASVARRFEAIAAFMWRTSGQTLSRLLGIVEGAAVGRPVVALTFDDGPHPETTLRVLDVLERHRARATFFLVGRAAQRHPDVVDRIVAGGHAIANHTLDHVSLPGLARRGQRDQIVGGAEAIGARCEPLLRPPWGHIDLASWWVARRHGQEVVGWSHHVTDWLEADPETFAARLRAALVPGAIVLLHDAPQPQERRDGRARADLIAALDTVLGESAPHWEFVTVPSLLASGRARRRIRWRVADAIARSGQLTPPPPSTPAAHPAAP